MIESMTCIPVTFKDLMDFVMLNKGLTTFMGYNEGQIAFLLSEGIKNGTLFYLLDSNSSISGMLLATVYHERKIVFIDENLAMSMKNLRALAKMLKEKYVGYSVEAFRHGSLRRFNTRKLLNKLIPQKIWLN